MTKLQMKEKLRRTLAKIEEYAAELETPNPITKDTRVAIGCAAVVERLRKILKEAEL